MKDLYREQNSHFAAASGEIHMKRSKFNRPFTHKTTFNFGNLVPVAVDEILPGDTVKMDTAALIRMSTPIFPVMDDAYLDLYWFFVPSRLVWEHFQQFMGENDKTAWQQPVDYVEPHIMAQQGFAENSIADYMGIPPRVKCDVSALPFRAYVKVWNDWFRDQNVDDSAYYTVADADVTLATADVARACEGGQLLRVNRFHDYFSSALPQAQKGPAVAIMNTGAIPVNGLAQVHDVEAPWKFPSGNEGKSLGVSLASNLAPGTADSGLPMGGTSAIPNNVWADLSKFSGVTVNELRLAFQMQKFFERQARGGSRYVEWLRSEWGVVSPDARLQRSEYLGGHRIRINMEQVAQTSSTDTTSPQGNVSAYSLTSDAGHSFTHSFVEHGYLLCVACARTAHSYQQGIAKMWSRRTRWDHYTPLLACIGEQPILNKEIYAQGTSVDDEVFGYQEAWADYRYHANRISGSFRSTDQQSLDAWHYADKYTSLPMLSPSWMKESPANVKRTLAVSSTLEDQLLCDFAFKGTWTRVMPLYSVPGFADHF